VWKIADVAAGSIYYQGIDGVYPLATGTNGYVLTTHGAMQAPTWEAGLWEVTGTNVNLITSKPIDIYDDVNMHGTGLSEVGTIALKDLNSWINCTGGDIVNVASISGGMGADIKFWGSDDSYPGTLMEYMRWDQGEEELHIKERFILNNPEGIIDGSIGFGNPSGNQGWILYNADTTDAIMISLRSSVQMWITNTEVALAVPLDLGGNSITGIGGIKACGIELTDSLKLDGATGKVKIEENDSTGDMEFTVKSGDAFVFKVVS